LNNGPKPHVSGLDPYDIAANWTNPFTSTLQLCDLKCLKVLLVVIYEDHCIISTYLCFSLVNSLGEQLKVIFTLWNFFWIAIVGDITPSDGISKEEKSRQEREALDHMCKLLGGGSRGTLFTNSMCAHVLLSMWGKWICYSSTWK